MKMAEYECVEKGILLTFQELMLLLQSVGVQYMNGFYRAEGEISDQEVLFLTESLVKKGVLIAAEQEFFLDDTVEAMLRCMGWPDEDYELEQENAVVYCYERSEKVLVTKIYSMKENTLELVLYSKEEFQRRIRKEETL